MSTTVAEIAQRVRTGGAPSDRLLGDVACLIERFTEGRYEDPIYGPLGFPAEWLPLRLTAQDLDELVEALIAVMVSSPDAAARAAWALGKARHERAVDHLIATLGECWRSEGALTFQILWALGTYGEDRAWPLIERIAVEGAGEPREEARRMLRARALLAGGDGPP